MRSFPLGGWGGVGWGVGGSRNRTAGGQREGKAGLANQLRSPAGKERDSHHRECWGLRPVTGRGCAGTTHNRRRLDAFLPTLWEPVTPSHVLCKGATIHPTASGQPGSYACSPFTASIESHHSYLPIPSAPPTH